MDLEALAPIIEDIIRQSLYQKIYQFGFAKYQGRGNKVASGSLARSISVNVENRTPTLQVLQVMMNDYAQWVQSGRLKNKRLVPVGSLLKWIKERNLKGRDKKGRYIKDKSFAFAIQQNIKKYGIRPANFIDVSIEKILNNQQVIDILGEATYEDLLNQIEGL